MKVGACRSVIRFDVAWKLTNAYLLPRPTPFLQVTRSVMDQKKIKTLTTVWRLACTQSSSHEEYMVKDATVDFGIQHNSSVAGRTEITQQQLADESDQGRTLERRSMPSTEKKHTIRIEAAGSLIRYISRSSSQKKIEVEREVDIKFQSAKKEDYILIKGNSAESVARASEELQLLINEAIKSPTLDYTHFVSLPLAIHPQLVEKLINFQNSILGIKNDYQVKDLDSDGNEDTSNEYDMDLKLNGAPAPTIAVKITAPEDNESRKVKINNIPVISYPPKASRSSVMAENSPSLCELGIDRSIFIKPNTFHLTVLMLKLYNKDLVDAAAKVLKCLPSKVMDTLDGRPVSIRLKGLECMKGSLAKARVLYAPVEEIGGQDRLLRACQVIIDAFVEAGLVIEKDAWQKLKLHATVMNARHRKRKKRTRNVDYFDARGIFEKFGSEEWGEYLIREAHLSRRFVFDESGYYQCCASIPFPENMAID